MKNNLDRKIKKLFHIIFPYYKGELNMKEQNTAVKTANKQTKPFEAKIGDRTYHKQKCVVCHTAGGKTYLKPISENDIVYGFVDDRNFAIGEVSKEGGSLFQQLLLLIAKNISKSTKSKK